MNMEKSIILYILLLIISTKLQILQAQNRANFEGTILENRSKNPIQFVTILLKENGKWAVTDINGIFKIPSISQNTYTIIISCLGYKEIEREVVIKEGTTNLNIAMEELSLGLDEVIVIAHEQKLVTASIIKQTAIQHVQPKSISDLFQLLPGHITENPTLSSPEQVKMREIVENGNSALGTAIIVDGIPISNDANLQITSTAKGGTTNSAPTVAGRGVDLRSITTGNIESIEIIRGIPSVEYGDLTSGVVIIKTKSGKTPYEVKVSIDPETKMFYAGKGFLLGKEKGAVNTSIDYAQAYSDKRKKYKGYERVTANLGYSNTFFKTTTPFTFNFKLLYHQTLDNNKTDPQLKSKEIIRSRVKGIRSSINGKWQINSDLLTNIRYNFSGSSSHHEDYNKNLKTVTAGTMPLGTSYTEGENVANYLPSEYYSELTIDGKPFSFFGQLISNTNTRISSGYNNIKLGIEWRSDGNNGQGKTFDINYPPTINSVSTLRPRSYKDIPALNKFSLFIEDKIKLALGKTWFTGQAGVRYTNIQPKGLFSTKGATTIEPRINLKYQILNSKNNSIFKNLAIRFGYGIAAKSPTLVHLYPDKAYFDEVSLNYYDSNSGSLAVMTTKIINDTSNPDLKPVYNKKKEIGIDFSINKISGKLTAYHEKQTDGYGFSRVPVFLEHRDYSIDGAGKSPFLIEGDGVYYYEEDEVLQAEYTINTAFHFYKTPNNNNTLIKKGVEYVINFGRIKVLRTTIVADGAWFYTERFNTKNTYKTIGTLYQGDKFPYIAVMPAGDKTIRQRLNTNIRVITHIPSIKMIVSLTTQILWFTKTKYEYESSNGIPYVYITQNKERIDVDNVYTYQGDNVIKNVAPIGYIDKYDTYYEWSPDSYNIQPYYSMVKTYSDTYFLEECLPIAFMFNLKLTKELANNLDLAFTANNFLNMRPYQKLKRSSGYTQRNTPLYFGAEIKFKF